MDKKPNILFIMSDQQRWDALGVHNPVIKTPHLDALIGRGILFDQAVCQNPMCIPSRYSFTTGLYSHQIGVRNNNQAIQDAAKMPIPTLFERLQQAVYLTIGSGKTHWHIGKNPTRDVEDPKPTTRGFEYRFMGRYPNGCDYEPGAIFHYDEAPEQLSWMVNYERKVGPNSGGESFDGYMGCTSPYTGEGMREHWLTTKGIETIEKLKHRDQPWHLFLSFDFPHAPLAVPQDFIDLYPLEELPDVEIPPQPLERHYNMWHSDGIVEQWEKLPNLERRQILRHYYALCSYIDAQYGRVFEYLKESGQEENTFVVFTSDHGDSLGERSRFSKYSLYEGSVRVPLIIAGAGIPEDKRGTRDSRCAELVDIVPTVLSVAGLEFPQELPGENLLEPSLRRGAFSELHGHGYTEIHYAPAYMWRTPEWKLILYYDHGTETPGDTNIINARRHSDQLRGELFNLKDDPKEYRNLYNDPEHFARREAMTRELFYNFALNTCYFPRYDSYAYNRPK